MDKTPCARIKEPKRQSIQNSAPMRPNINTITVFRYSIYSFVLDPAFSLMRVFLSSFISILSCFSAFVESLIAKSFKILSTECPNISNAIASGIITLISLPYNFIANKHPIIIPALIPTNI